MPLGTPHSKPMAVKITQDQAQAQAHCFLLPRLMPKKHKHLPKRAHNLTTPGETRSVDEQKRGKEDSPKTKLQVYYLNKCHNYFFRPPTRIYMP